MIVLDSETDEVIGNPIAKPPAAHGLAYIVPGSPPGYLHWRTEKANVRWSAVADFLTNIIESNEDILFHNAPFDLSVLQTEFPILPWHKLKKERIHDTMFQLFLADPYAPTLSLKPSAERYLGVHPEEQDKLVAWILSNVPGATRKTAGAHVVKAPLGLISPYAIGDVNRTWGIYEHLKNKVPQGAYDRERFLMPSLVDNSKRGIRVNRGLLTSATEQAFQTLKEADNRIREILQSPGLDVSSGSELADAVERMGMVDKWIHTKTGQRSIAKENLVKAIKDPNLVNLLLYRSSLSTCIGTFMVNWLDMSKDDGRLHPEWNQVRTHEEGKRYGTRTGRLSCSNPNLQNVPTEFDQTIPDGLPPLPFMRQFLLPEEGHVWLKRDFSSQEIRIAAHFEDGPLLAAYHDNPKLDPHQMAKELILSMLGLDFNRKHVKTTGFQIIYGGGANAISLKVGCSYNEAQTFKEAYLTAMPGIRALQKTVSYVARKGEPIFTWGGRPYYREISEKYPNRDFSYKMINYLIQGSAADQTKQCIIDWDAGKDVSAFFLATVHDEINISAPAESWQEHMRFLQEVMDADRLDCPMESEGFAGANWHDIETCE